MNGEPGVSNSIWMTGPQVCTPQDGGGSAIEAGATLIRQKPMSDGSEDCSRQTHGLECVYIKVENHAGLIVGRQIEEPPFINTYVSTESVAERLMSTHGSFYERQSLVHCFNNKNEVGSTVTNKISQYPTNILQMSSNEDKENQVPQLPSRPSRLSLPHMTPFQPQGIPQSVFDAANTLQSFRGQPHSLGQNGIPFRYQLRRPVESWKYVENKKEDGTLMYLCRICHAIYKHKKSLNKHWKDKHSVGSNGQHDGDGEDEDEEDDENDTTLPESSFNISDHKTPQEASRHDRENRPPSITQMGNNFRSDHSNSGEATQSLPRPLQSHRLSLPHASPARTGHMRASLRRPREYIEPLKHPHAFTPSSNLQKVSEETESAFQPFAKRRHSEFTRSFVDTSPLDLSLTKSIKSPTPIASEEEDSEVGPLRDRHVLSLLIQTALNALNGEPDSIKTTDALSSNTTSLLKAVGRILISSTGTKPEPLSTITTTASATPTTLVAPIGDEQSVGQQIQTPQPQSYQQLMATEFAEPQFSRNIIDQQEGAPGMDPVIPCTMCSFIARWFSELRAHMVNHSDHRMFGCCYCPYRAKWKWDVAKHMRRCPQARHVAHLQNECLLRMVCYFPPPECDILHPYFPQYGFPGVGIDKPISPPPEEPLILPPSLMKDHGEASSLGAIYLKTTQPLIATGESGRHVVEDLAKTEPKMEKLDKEEKDEEDDDKPLCIAEEMTETELSPPSLRPNELVDGKLPRSKTEELVTSPPLPSFLEPSSFEKIPRPKPSSLVFKLKRCAICNFHSSDDNELHEHVVRTHLIPQSHSQ